jgi:hypothetical protein
MVIDCPVKATLFYYTPPKDGSRPWSNIHASPETGVKEKNYESKPFEVLIENIRGNESTCISKLSELDLLMTLNQNNIHWIHLDLNITKLPQN